MKGPFDKLVSSMTAAVAKKISFDPVKVVKKFKYTLIREIHEGDVSLAVGTGGKVFNGIILANNKVTGEKVMIFVRKGGESPYSMLLNSSKENDLQDFVDGINEDVVSINGEDVSKSLKNKSLKTLFLANKAIKVLKNDWCRLIRVP